MKWMRNLPGDPFQEVLPHLVYVLAALMGNLKLASVMTTGGHGDKEETELRALFASGKGPVTLALSLEATPVQKFVRIYGTNMSLHIDLATNMLLRLRAPTDGIVGRALVNVDQSVQMASQTLVNTVKTLTGRLSAWPRDAH